MTRTQTFLSHNQFRNTGKPVAYSQLYSWHSLLEWAAVTVLDQQQMELPTGFLSVINDQNRSSGLYRYYRISVVIFRLQEIEIQWNGNAK